MEKGILFVPAWSTESHLLDLGVRVFVGTTMWRWHCQKRQKQETATENTIHFPRRKKKNGGGTDVKALLFQRGAQREI